MILIFIGIPLYLILSNISTPTTPSSTSAKDIVTFGSIAGMDYSTSNNVPKTYTFGTIINFIVLTKITFTFDNSSIFNNSSIKIVIQNPQNVNIYETTITNFTSSTLILNINNVPIEKNSKVNLILNGGNIRLIKPSLSFEYNKNTAKIVFAHATNTIKAVDWAMSLGVNGLEMDLRFNPDTNMPSEFRHSTEAITDICDCTIGFSSKNNVCYYLNPPCTAKENATTMFRHLAINYNNKLAVLYIDAKLDSEDKPKSFQQAGEKLVELIDTELFSKGFIGQVIISAGYTSSSEYIKSAVNASKKTKNGDKYYFTYDGLTFPPNFRTGKDVFESAVKGLIDADTKNRVYSVGTTPLLPQTFYDAISLAVYNKKIGTISSTGIWTIDLPSSMENYLNFGVDSIMTNVPSEALKIIKNRGLTLATPGNALRPSTNNTIITEIPAGEICESNSNCILKACGRDTVESNALKICCPSGKVTNYLGYDYCTGMKKGDKCFTNSMCKSNNCSGNLFGLRTGNCT